MLACLKGESATITLLRQWVRSLLIVVTRATWGVDNMGQAVGGIIAFAIVLMVISILGAFALMIAVVAMGVLLLFVTKSRRPLINSSSAIVAILEACELSAAITVGLFLASFPTFAMLSSWEAFSAKSVFDENMGSYSGIGVASFAYSWLGADALKFFATTAMSLFVANRVAVLRDDSERRLLAAVPPLFAGFLLLVTYGLAGSASELRLDRLWEALSAMVSSSLAPYMEAYESLLAGREISSWAVRTLIDTDGSLFQLTKYLPPLMLIISIGFVIVPSSSESNLNSNHRAFVIPIRTVLFLMALFVGFLVSDFSNLETG